MKKTVLFLLLWTISITKMIAHEPDTLNAYYDKIEKSFNYESGKIKLTQGEGTLNVPKGFKFLNGEQTQNVLSIYGEIQKINRFWVRLFQTEKVLHIQTAGCLS